MPLCWIVRLLRTVKVLQIVERKKREREMAEDDLNQVSGLLVRLTIPSCSEVRIRNGSSAWASKLVNDKPQHHVILVNTAKMGLEITCGI